MGSRGAGRHHHPVEFPFFYHLKHLFLGVLRAGIEIVFHVGYIGQGAGIVSHRHNIYHPGDVNPAMADKDTDTRWFPPNVGFFHRFSGDGQGIPCWCENAAGCRCGSTCLHHRLGNVFGAPETAAHKYSRLRGCSRLERAGGTKAIRVQIYPQLLGHFYKFRGCLHAHGKNRQVEDFLFYVTKFIHVGEYKVVCVGFRINGVDTGAKEPHAMDLPGAVIVPLEILAESAHIHVENSGLQPIFGMLFGDDGLLYCIHAADRGAVAMVAVIDIPGAHALEPGDLLGLLLIRRPN